MADLLSTCICLYINLIDLVTLDFDKRKGARSFGKILDIDPAHHYQKYLFKCNRRVE